MSLPEPTGRGLMETKYGRPEVDRIWLWVYFNKIRIYPIFYLLKGDYMLSGCRKVFFGGFAVGFGHGLHVRIP